jgi:hypothetical protein
VLRKHRVRYGVLLALEIRLREHHGMTNTRLIGPG